MPEWSVGGATGAVELPEELDIVEPESVDRGAEEPEGEVHQVKQQGEDRSDDRAADRAGHLVGDNRQHHRRRADRHDAGVGQDVSEHREKLDGR